MVSLEYDVGLIGMGVMGANLVLNIADHGFSVVVYDAAVEKTREFIQKEVGNRKIKAAGTLRELVGLLRRPRAVILLVPAGTPVDAVIGDLMPHFEPGDLLIDGGNSHFTDTNRREKALVEKGLLFMGMGVSGGEYGARHGPSLMPGGPREGYERVRPILQAIAAKVEDGTPCCDWVGGDGAGHFVKMVHNGIEYGDMQLICEAYQIMKELLGMSAAEMHAVFKQWNAGDLNSYLIEITADILAFKDADGQPLVEKILDTAGQKGTGKWTSVVSLDLGVPLTLISEAVFARCLSAMKDERVEASKVLRAPKLEFDGDRQAFLNDLEQALYASKIISYTQGFVLMHEAAKEYRWNLNYGGVALLWRGGCIIRSIFLGKIKEAFAANPGLPNLLLDRFFGERIERSQQAWRRVVSTAVLHGVWVPAMSTGLCYYDGLRNARLPANLLQAQRDYFGAHQYERIDKPRGQFFHTNWTGHGGDTSSSSYNV